MNGREKVAVQTQLSSNRKKANIGLSRQARVSSVCCLATDWIAKLKVVSVSFLHQRGIGCEKRAAKIAVMHENRAQTFVVVRHCLGKKLPRLKKARSKSMPAKLMT
eukprot:scaffold2904_cov173-Amphora_coffeaeformis.AAC.12